MQVAARGQVTYLYAEYGQDKSIVRSRWYTINGSDSLVETGESGSYYTTKTLAMQYITLAGNVALIFNGFKHIYDGFVLTYKGFGVSELDTQYTILRTFLYNSGLGDENPEFGEEFDWEQYSELLTAYEDAEKRINDNISQFLKGKIDEKIDRDDVNYLVNALASDDTVISGGVVLGSFIGVKDGSSVVAAINASSSIAGFYDEGGSLRGHGVLMLAAGISDVTTAKSTASFRVFEDGFMYASNAEIEGTITAKGGTIGGWTINTTQLNSGSGTSYVAINGGSASTYAIWAGNTTASSAPFYVKKSGEMKASSGTIGGWTIGDNSLSSGASTTFVSLNSNSSVSYALWAGAQVAANAPFSVTKAGALKATSGTIGGFEITANSIGKEFFDPQQMDDKGVYITPGRLNVYGEYAGDDVAFIYMNTPVGSGYSYSTPVINVSASYYNNASIAMQINSGFEDADRESVAIKITRGRLWGIRPKTLCVYSDTTLTEFDYTVVVNASSSITITLPEIPQLGQMYVITHVNSNSIVFSSGETYNIFYNANSTSSNTISIRSRGLYTLTFCEQAYTGGSYSYSWILTSHIE